MNLFLQTAPPVDTNTWYMLIIVAFALFAIGSGLTVMVLKRYIEEQQTQLILPGEKPASEEPIKLHIRHFLLPLFFSLAGGVILIIALINL